MAETIAARAPFLIAYMGNHPDTLVSYAKWFGKVSEPLTSAQMVAINEKSMTLTCVLKDGKKKAVRVDFNPPLRNYDEVKPRMLEMKAQAEEGLGMVKKPKIADFKLPWNGTFAATAVYVFGILYLKFHPERESIWWAPARAALAYPFVASTVTNLFNVTAVLHILESFYTLYLCYSYSTPFLATLQYVGATLAMGFSIWSDFRKRVQDARIASILKVN